MAGYSGTPLLRKLGIEDGQRLYVQGAPAPYANIVGKLPESVELVARATKQVDLVHCFTCKRAELATRLRKYRDTLRPDAVVWISWPKKAAKVATDISEDVVRAEALPLGFVDVKVCAVDDVWSGLKLVVRKELREASARSS